MLIYTGHTHSICTLAEERESFTWIDMCWWMLATHMMWWMAPHRTLSVSVCCRLSCAKRGDNLEQTLEMIIVILDKERVYLIHEDSSMCSQNRTREYGIDCRRGGLKRRWMAGTLIRTSTLITVSISFRMVISLCYFFVDGASQRNPEAIHQHSLFWAFFQLFYFFCCFSCCSCCFIFWIKGR